MIKKSGHEIIRLGEQLSESLAECSLCPMDCKANRLAKQTGKCNSTNELKIASFNLHFGEEPPLSGGGGSGTIFLSNCSLFCCYCQNYPISQLGTGSVTSIDKFVDMLLDLQKRGAENINFVTPDHMLPMILLGLGKAKIKGLDLPVVYNCSGYQKIEILRQLKGIIDIYLVDMRYSSNALAKKYSGCENYVEVNRLAVKEMFRQVGNLKFNRAGLAKSGLIIRHLVLPGFISGSAGIFKFLANEVSKDVYISLMSQYFPAYRAVKDDILSRSISATEYNDAIDAFEAAGLSKGFMQSTPYESTY
jgi:putative pyruvate formate lyase activating enzyme